MKSASMRTNRRTFLIRCLLASAGVCLLPSLSMVVQAGDDSALAKWKAMTPEQRETIKKRWAEYKGLSPDSQAAARSTYEKFSALPLENQKQVLANYDHWKTLSPEQQSSIRRHFADWKKLKGSEQEELRKAADELTSPGKVNQAK